MNRNKCGYCENYMVGLDECKFCHFEPEEEYLKDDWDILNLDEDYEWEHLQIMYRLQSQNIDCLGADIWYDNNMAYLVGCTSNSDRIAKALGIHVECIYSQFELGFVILNLFQEKCIREKETNDKLKDFVKESTI